MNKKEYQETLDYIKTNVCEDGEDFKCDDCIVKEYCDYYSSCNILQEAIDKANKYDEKETPKKVVLHYKHHLGTAWGTFVSRITCPSCNRRLKDKIPNNQLFCPRCGQKLDWSETHE